MRTRNEVVIRWVPDDIRTLRPDWTQDQCEDMLHVIGEHLKDRSTEVGWEIMDMLLTINEEKYGEIAIS